MRHFFGPLSNLDDRELCLLHRVYCRPSPLIDQTWLAMKRDIVYSRMLMRIPVDFLYELHHLKEELNLKSYED